jgi:hypothetical protein
VQKLHYKFISNQYSSLIIQVPIQVNVGLDSGYMVSIGWKFFGILQQSIG